MAVDILQLHNVVLCYATSEIWVGNFEDAADVVRRLTAEVVIRFIISIKIKGKIFRKKYKITTPVLCQMQAEKLLTENTWLYILRRKELLDYEERYIKPVNKRLQRKRFLETEKKLLLEGEWFKKYLRKESD